jgi:hypothetical protein
MRVITKLPNSEQSYKGKVKTHKYITDKISQQPKNCENRNDPDLVQAFLKKWWVESDFKAQAKFQRRKKYSWTPKLAEAVAK